MKKTLIQVDEEVWKILSDRKQFKESFNDVLRRDYLDNNMSFKETIKTHNPPKEGVEEFFGRKMKPLTAEEVEKLPGNKNE